MRPIYLLVSSVLLLGCSSMGMPIDGGLDGGLPDGAVADRSVAVTDDGGVRRDGRVVDTGVLDGARDEDVGVSVGRTSLVLIADEGRSDGIVSVGVPFSPGQLRDASALRVLDEEGEEQASNTGVLARWITDDSIRSVLLNVEADLEAGERAELTIEYGVARTVTLAGEIVARPDGPVAALLSSEWLAGSLVAGPQLPASANIRFSRFDTIIADELYDMEPSFDSYGVSCGSTSSHRTYYDSPHAMWIQFLRSTGEDSYRRARSESRWYRDNELEWHEALAVQVCENDDWTVDEPLGWSVLRRMTGQGMLNDYLLTGDPAAREAAMGFGRAFVANLPALIGGSENVLRVTERNLAWTMMGVLSYYAIDGSVEAGDALSSLISEAAAWQGAGSSGAFEHDINRPDPDECGDGPRGGSPFMTALLIDALMMAYELTGDDRIPTIVEHSAVWFRDSAVTPGGDAFRYLWGCEDNGYEGTGAELNNLIVHVFGAAFAVTGDGSWLTTGDGFADAGLDEIYASRPKQWTQTVRGFSRYLGYRAQGATP